MTTRPYRDLGEIKQDICTLINCEGKLTHGGFKNIIVSITFIIFINRILGLSPNILLNVGYLVSIKNHRVP